MNRYKNKIKHPTGSGWKNIMEFMTALRIDNTLLKKCFLYVLLVQTSLFFVVLPSGCTKSNNDSEAQEKIVYRSIRPAKHEVRQRISDLKKGQKLQTTDQERLFEQKSLGYVSSSPAPSQDKDRWDESGRYNDNFNTEEYQKIVENPFLETMKNPLSTFSIDVDTASYSNVRRFLQQGSMPNPDAVRIEEMVNYFDYNYPEPNGVHPFSITTNLATCPWNEKHQLVRIGIQGQRLKEGEKKANNLVFLLDVSGSMASPEKLPLLKQSFKIMLENLEDEDMVSIVVYAGAAGVVLEPTPAEKRDKILAALNNLEAGGSTAGGAGIALAYKLAEEHLIKDGNNRIILATDGDFNIGVSSTSDLVRMIEEKRDKGIYITILGFGMGNYKDDRMEQIADKGNGNYFYIDNLNEAKKVLSNDLTSTLFTIAKDVKIQIEFNPAKIQAYRLIGYENRMLKKEDFNDDKKDAGELGAGHRVTALYEIVPVGVKFEGANVDELEYQKTKISEEAYNTDEIMKVKFRYKPIDSDKSLLIVERIKEGTNFFNKAPEDFRFAVAVAAYGMLLRDSKYRGDINYNTILKIAEDAKGKDEFGYRNELIEMIKTAKQLDTKQR